MLLEGRPQAREASFLRALMATFSSSFLLSMGFKLIQDLLSFINPQLLRSVHAPSRTALPGTRGWPGGRRVGKEPQSRNWGAISIFCGTLGKWQSLCTSFPHSHPTSLAKVQLPGTPMYTLANILSLNPPNSPTEDFPFYK